MSTTISDHIRGDLADRIGSGLGPPAALTLAALAKHKLDSEERLETWIEQDSGIRVRE